MSQPMLEYQHLLYLALISASPGKLPPLLLSFLASVFISTVSSLCCTLLSIAVTNTEIKGNLGGEGVCLS